MNNNLTFSIFAKNSNPLGYSQTICLGCKNGESYPYMMYDNITVIQAKEGSPTSGLHNWFIAGAILLIIVTVSGCYYVKKQEQMAQDQDEEQNDRSKVYRAKARPAYD
jgi:hypothetical protein